MARYYFHLHERDRITLDEEGLDLPDCDAARGKAIEAARSIMSHDVFKGVLSLQGHIDIVGDDDAHRQRVAFRDALSVSE